MANTIDKTRLNKVIKAARSGKYNQAKSKLKNSSEENCFCFLGIMCEISRLGKWLPNKEYYLLPNGEVCRNKLSESVYQWYGFDVADPILNVTPSKPNQIKIPISRLNDFYNYSFVEIADLIEKQFLIPQKN